MRVKERLIEAIRTFGNTLYHFQRPVGSWEEREEAEKTALAALSHTEGFLVLQDVYDSRVREVFEAWLAESDDTKALALHRHGRALAEVIGLTDKAVSAHEREKMLKRQVDLLTVDRARRVDLQRRATQRAMTATST